MSRALDLLTGWLLFAGLLGAVGSLAVRWTVLPRAVRPAGDDAGFPEAAWLDAGAARMGRAASALLVPALVLVFFRQLTEFRDPFVPWTDDARLLLATPWGAAWRWGVAGSVAAMVGFWAARPGRRRGWWLAAPAVLGLSAFPAATGHANAGTLRWLTLSADTLHVLAAGAWMGGLATILLLERRWRRDRSADAGATLLPALVPVFSPLALTSVAVLATTGILASWIQLPELAALWGPGYGRLLLLKLVVVAGVFGMGALNWRRLIPKLSHAEGAPAMRRAATVELLLAQAVLLVTALLVRTSPTGH